MYIHSRVVHNNTGLYETDVFCSHALSVRLWTTCMSDIIGMMCCFYHWEFFFLFLRMHTELSVCRRVPIRVQVSTVQHQLLKVLEVPFVCFVPFSSLSLRVFLSWKNKYHLSNKKYGSFRTLWTPWKRWTSTSERDQKYKKTNIQYHLF